MTVDTPLSTAVNITCSRDELAQALQLVGRAVSTRTSVQILAGILLRAEGDRVLLSATDMEMSLRVSVEAQVSGEGSVVVPGRLLVEIVRLLPPGEVTLGYDENESIVSLTCGSSAYRLNIYRADDFPRLPEVDPASLVAVPREALLETVQKVSRAASRDESRPVLTGILVQLSGASLVMAATDSYRLCVKETALDRDTGQELEAIVPAKALGELVRVAQSASSDQIMLGVQENQVVCVVDGVVLTARRIDGQFPNYRQLRPESFEAEVRVARDELLDAVRRVAVMAQRNAPLRLRFEEGGLTIEVQAQDVGEAREAVPVAYAGDVLEIGFNPDFLREGVESVNEPEVCLKLISPLRPGLITGAGDDFWYLIMPIRLAG
ncbi:MAG: DNA polymerase III subunit beta [Gaiellales bacterium]